MEVPRETLHKQLHDLVPMVPVPNSINAECALVQLRMLEDKGVISNEDEPEKRLLLLAALFDCAEQATADAFRQQANVIHEFYKKRSSE